MVSAVDETIGAIYDALEETGMVDNTLIAFSSDVSSTSIVYKMTFLKLETRCLTLRTYLTVFLFFHRMVENLVALLTTPSVDPRSPSGREEYEFLDLPTPRR